MNFFMGSRFTREKLRVPQAGTYRPDRYGITTQFTPFLRIKDGTRDVGSIFETNLL